MRFDFKKEIRKIGVLKPKLARALWLEYESASFDELREVQEAIRWHLSRDLGEGPLQNLPNLPPPSKIEASGGFDLGQVMFANREMHPFGLREQDWLRHVGIFGITGSGKTNLVVKMLSELRARQVPFLVFDWKKNYRDLLQDVQFRNLQVFTVGSETSPFRFNPLIPPPGVSIRLWKEKLIEIIGHAYFTGEGVAHVLEESSDTVFRRYAELLDVSLDELYSTAADAKGGYPTFSDLYSVLKGMRARGRYSLWLASTIRAVRRLSMGSAGSVFEIREPVPLSEILQKDIVLELDGLVHSDKVFFVEALCLWLFYYRLNEGKREELKHVTVIEEAHHILSKSKVHQTGAETILDTIFKEIRELGEGLVVVDQNPHLLSPVAIGNTNCTVSLNLKYPRDTEVIGSTLLLEEPAVLSKLPIGTALCKLQSRYFEPFALRIPKQEIEKGQVSDDRLAQHMKGRYPTFENSAYPRVSHVSIGDNRGMDTRNFLKDVKEHPESTIRERYKRLGLHSRRGKEIQDALVGQGLLKARIVRKGNTLVKLLEISTP